MTNESLPQPWRSFLSETDENIEEEVAFHCLGGFVVTILYGLERSTADVDVVLFVPRSESGRLIEKAGKNSFFHQKYGVYLDPVTIVNVPENYEERLTEMFAGSFNSLRLFALDPYDLMLSKLERNSQKDRDDVKHLASRISFDPKILEERYKKELRPYLAIPEREDLTFRLWMEMLLETE